MSIEPVLALTDIEFGWAPGSTLLSIPQLSIRTGESVFLRGPSGSGKSTLLGLIGGVLTPRKGSIRIKGHDLTLASPSQRDQIRADHLGIIFQQFNLLPFLSVIGNVTLPCRFSRTRHTQSQTSDGSVEDEARDLVEQLGLPPSVLNTPVNELSVGQQQRVAVARALIGGPDLIIADEPTSALDSDNRDRFVDLLNVQRQRFNSSLLFVSHDAALARHFDRVEDLSALNQNPAEPTS